MQITWQEYLRQAAETNQFTWTISGQRYDPFFQSMNSDHADI